MDRDPGLWRQASEIRVSGDDEMKTIKISAVSIENLKRIRDIYYDEIRDLREIRAKSKSDKMIHDFTVQLDELEREYDRLSELIDGKVS